MNRAIFHALFTRPLVRSKRNTRLIESRKEDRLRRAYIQRLKRERQPTDGIYRY